MTHKTNHERASKITGIDLVANPNAAMRPDVAAKIQVTGCSAGIFTGKRLSDYLPGDYVNARRVVNGTDRAADIARLAVGYETALMKLPVPVPVIDAEPDEPPAEPTSAAPGGGVIVAIIAAIGALAAFILEVK